MRSKVAGLLSLLVACSSDNFVTPDSGSDAGAFDGAGDAAPSDGGPSLETLATEPGAIGRVEVDGDWVYYVVGTLNELHRVPKVGGTIETLLATDSMRAFALTPSSIYVAGYSGGPYAIPRTGGAKALLPNGCQLGVGIAALDDDVTTESTTVRQT